MSTEISHENEAFIQEQILSGKFESRSEVLDAGIELLKLRTDLQDRFAESRRQLDSGEHTEYDDEALQGLFQRLKDRVRQKNASKQTDE